MPDSSNRVAYKVALLAALRAEVATADGMTDVQVIYGWPGDQERPDTIYLGSPVSGDLTDISTGDPNTSAADVFIVPVRVIASTKGGQASEAGLIAADERCEALVRLVQQVVRTRSKRPDLVGTTASVASLTGPDAYEVKDMPPRSTADLLVQVTTITDC